MALTTTNGMSVDDLAAAPNGPGLAQQLGNQVDAFYGSSVANAAALPATGKFPGQHVWVADIGTVAIWNSTTLSWDGIWKTYSTTVTNLPTSAKVARFRKVGKTVDFTVQITASSAATGDISISLPSTAKSVPMPIGTALGLRGASAATGTVYLNTATSAVLVTATGVFWNGGVPSASASGNVIYASGTYEEA